MKSEEAKEIEQERQRTQNQTVTSPKGVSRQFNRAENTVIQTLYRYGQPLTIKKIAEKSEVSWDTIEAAIKTLEKDEFVFSEEKNGKTYWNLNY